MYFDWVTWSIWLMGLVILIVWIIVPLKEFKKLATRHQKPHAEEETPST